MCYGSLQKFRWTRFFYSLTFFRFSGGQTGSTSFHEVVSILGPQKTGTTTFSFILSKTSCRRIIQGRAPRSFVVKLDQLVLEFSCSRQRRPKNVIFILKSSSLRFHRGAAKFTAQTRRNSRRFEEFFAQMTNGWRYSWKTGTPEKRWKKPKSKKTLFIESCVMTYRTSVQNFRF